MSNTDLPDFELRPDLQPESENENFTDVIEEIKESTDDGTGNGLGTKVVIFNDNYHTFDQVITQIMKAIGCSEETAFYHANTIHTKGPHGFTLLHHAKVGGENSKELYDYLTEKELTEMNVGLK